MLGLCVSGPGTARKAEDDKDGKTEADGGTGKAAKMAVHGVLPYFTFMH